MCQLSCSLARRKKKEKEKYGEAKLIWVCSLSALGKAEYDRSISGQKKTALVEA